MGTLDEIGDEDEFFDTGWKSDADRVEEILARFQFEPLEPTLVDRVRLELDAEDIRYLRVIGEFDAEMNMGVLRVILEDGTEVSFP